MLKKIRAKSIIGLFGLVVLVGCGTAENDRVWVVPMVRVLSNPDFFDGEYVFTRGYLSKNANYLHFSIESKNSLDTLSAIALFPQEKTDGISLPDECFDRLVEISGVIKVAVVNDFNGPTYEHIYTIESFPAGSCYVDLDE